MHLDNHEDDEAPWIQWWCSLRGNEFFCEVSESFIRDNFNLTGLHTQVANFEDALDVILDATDDDSDQIQAAAEQLYGLIHARYILTARGLSQMAEKYVRGDFGTCPRVLCNHTHVAPGAVTDRPGVDFVRLFCPSCKELYKPSTRRHMLLDGAHFGTTFPHMLFHMHPALLPSQPATTERYEPRIFGFRVHPSAWEPVQEAHSGDEAGQREKGTVTQQPATTNSMADTANKRTASAPGAVPEALTRGSFGPF